jgi:hypothetical protein
MEKQNRFLGIANPTWGVIGVVALVALILAFYAIDNGITVF